jgi:hypothetical protein
MAIHGVLRYETGWLVCQVAQCKVVATFSILLQYIVLGIFPMFSLKLIMHFPMFFLLFFVSGMVVWFECLIVFI